MPRPVPGERAAAGELQDDEEHRGGYDEYEALRGQPGRGGQRRGCLEQPVDPERAGQGHRQPRHRAVADGDDHDGRRRQPQRDPLRGPQPFPQDEDAEQHPDQRGHVVAERGLDDQPHRDAPDEQTPVHRDEHRGRGCREPPAGTEPAHVAPAAQHGQHHRHQHGGPQHAVSEDLQRRRGVQQRPERQEQTPQHVRADARGEPGGFRSLRSGVVRSGNGQRSWSLRVVGHGHDDPVRVCHRAR